MSTSTDLSSQEKIDAIYSMLRASEARASRAFWYRVLRLCIIFGMAYFTITHPEYVVGKVTNYLQPIITEQMQFILSTQKNMMIDQVKKMIPEQPLKK